MPERQLFKYDLKGFSLWTMKMNREKNQPLTSILPKLLPYRRLKKFAIFAAVGSLESVGMQQLRQYATTLYAIWGHVVVIESF
jgi:hypothetical protein